MLSKVNVGSVTDKEALDELIGDNTVDAIYSDPPWGPGNVQYWRTVNKMDLPGWFDLLRGLVAAADRCKGPVFFEQGLRFEGDMVDAMKTGGHVLTGRWVTRYGHPKRPAVLLLFDALPPSDLVLDGLGGVKLVMTALRPWAKPGRTVLDPCCGLGTTCAAAKRLGMTVLGLEASASRASRAWLRL